ncbi:MAG: hypothetical protein WCI05_00245 [Myxococcales bacterium]
MSSIRFHETDIRLPRRSQGLTTKTTVAAAALILAIVGAADGCSSSTSGGAAVVPIPQQAGSASVQQFIGNMAVPRSVAAPSIPSNPFLGQGSWSNVHNDTYMSDTYSSAGPLGQNPTVLSTWLGNDRDQVALVVGMTWDSSGRIVAGAIKPNSATNTTRVQLTLLDPVTLQTLATYDLPEETMASATDFRPAGTYFYTDKNDRTVIGTVARKVWVVSHSGSSFTLDNQFDLTGAIPDYDSMQALQPDFSGRLWFTSKGGTNPAGIHKGGVVGVLDLSGGQVLGTYQMPDEERIVNSHATDETGGAFIASTMAMYRFDTNTSGAPTVTWREVYDQGTRVKPGQTDIGTGTTPTLMGTKYVTITDNADPRMHVMVYRRDKEFAGTRRTCFEPVFGDNAGDTENSLVATDTSIVVENNYGYSDPSVTTGGKTTEPGLTRIDLDANGACHTVWSNSTLSIPSVVTKMSLQNGLIYSYSKPVGPGQLDPWYFTAVDFVSGEVVYRQLAGTGALYNNHYAPVYLGPNGTFYVGVLGGIVAMRDTP